MRGSSLPDDPRAHRTQWRARRPDPPALLFLLAAVPLSGCHGLPMQAGSKPITQAERLMAAHADLHTGRFAVIADFEHPRHMGLFRSLSSSPGALHQLDLTSGIPTTGGRCLRADFERPDDELIAVGSATRQWHFPRDWRDYDLLLLSVHSHTSETLRLTLISGKGDLRALADARIPLRAGWNSLRLDLADAAEHVALDDVREVRWSLPDLSGPAVLLIDDVILANNRVDVFGDSSAEDGSLFVRRRGRRWDVGVGSDFEVGFINGQIRSWYDLATDPMRTRNLVEGCVLGPSIVSITGPAEGTAALESFPAWGERVIARQRIIEASAGRVVVACNWDFVSGQPGDSEGIIRQAWTYSIYPTGELYVHVECTTRTPDWSAGRIGLAVSRRKGENVSAFCHSTSQLGDTGKLLHVPYAYVSGGGTPGPDLLFAVHDGRSAPLMRCIKEDAISRVSAVAFGGETADSVQQWDCLLALSRFEADAARDRAVQFCFPVTVSPSVGNLVRDAPGDGNGDGFNESDGTYVLSPDGNRILISLGESGPTGAPVFLVRSRPNSSAWVYLDYVVLEDVGRTTKGDWLFQVPLEQGVARTLEVYLRPLR